MPICIAPSLSTPRCRQLSQSAASGRSVLWPLSISHCEKRVGLRCGFRVGQVPPLVALVALREKSPRGRRLRPMQQVFADVTRVLRKRNAGTQHDLAVVALLQEKRARRQLDIEEFGFNRHNSSQENFFRRAFSAALV